MDNTKISDMLIEQYIVKGEKQRDISDALSTRVEIQKFNEGEVILGQDDSGSDMYFILEGEVKIFLNGRPYTTRKKGVTVGEMALANLGSKRSATIKAGCNNCILAKITKDKFREVAYEYPSVLEQICKDLSNRLLERNEREEVKNPFPRVFIASSGESKNLVEIVKNHVEENFNKGEIEFNPWYGSFDLSQYPMEALEEQLKISDFAVIMVTPDDISLSKFKFWKSARDNVIFEAGLFMGKITRKRVFIVHPDSCRLKIPSDIQGITTLRYKNNRKKGVNLIEVGNKIANAIKILDTK